MDPWFDGEAARKESLSRLLGLADHFEKEDPAMHKTNTVDYAVVFEARLQRLVERWIAPRVLHPYPMQRFDASHPRWEPYGAVRLVDDPAGESPAKCKLPSWHCSDIRRRCG
jgi:hypothetical protein